MNLRNVTVKDIIELEMEIDWWRADCREAFMQYGFDSDEYKTLFYEVTVMASKLNAMRFRFERGLSKTAETPYD